jgi:hypothetical protein
MRFVMMFMVYRLSAPKGLLPQHMLLKGLRRPGAHRAPPPGGTPGSAARGHTGLRGGLTPLNKAL